MCGIVGYVGRQAATDFLIEGLRRLEYRGYDSSGVATLTGGGELRVVKTAGRIEDLVALLAESPLAGSTGIGHTRWATHGAATDINAHPHVGPEGAVTIVHNGVIENFRPIRRRLIEAGHRLISETDSEIVAHLICEALQCRSGDPERGGEDRPAGGVYAPLVAAVRDALAQLRGTYGILAMFRDHPEVIIAARLGSPMVVGVGHGAHFIGSDTTPMAGHTDKIVYLNDHELAVITADDLLVLHRDQGRVRHSVQVVEVSRRDIELEGFPHYMLKEIHEQPESLRAAMRGRLNKDDATAVFGGLKTIPTNQLRSVNRIVLTGCGTSWHAALVGEYLLEEFARVPVEVEYASELRYRNPPMDYKTLVFAITQSGETADTLGALRELKRKGHTALSICNVVGSTIAQESDGGIYLHAGPEIGVASTKAFTSQCVTLAMLALYWGRLHHLSFEAGLRIITELQRIPEQVERALQTDAAVRKIAEKYADCDNFLYLGRQYNFPTALEGALKLKEISYIHAEGYPAAEMKHGPIALVDEQTPSLFLIPSGFIHEKVLANLEEIKARRGPVIAVVGESRRGAAELADDVIAVPDVPDYLQPIVMSIPLQLLAYHVAVLRGCDVDKPRNLAKSVTVE